VNKVDPAPGTSYPVIVVDDGSADPAAIARLCKKRGARLKRRRAVRCASSGLASTATSSPSAAASAPAWRFALAAATTSHWRMRARPIAA
jgi:hypothetical protein